jgi:hypothetical protein
MSQFGNFLEPEFEISGINFRIVKANAEEGFHLLELVRSAITDPSSMRMAEGASQETSYAALMRAIVAVNPEKLAKLREEFFKYVEVRFPQTQQYDRIPKVRNLLMNAIEAPDNYEILARAILVNFSKSFLGLLTRLGLQTPEEGGGSTGS